MAFPSDSSVGSGLRFPVLKKLSYDKRIKLILAFILGGVLIQIFFNTFAGLPFIFIGVLLGLPRSLSNEPGHGGKKKWENVTIEECRRALELIVKTKEWARNPYHVASPMGFLLLFVLIAASVGIFVFLFVQTGDPPLFLILDGAIIFIPLYVTGNRKGWKPAGLEIKLRALMNIYDDMRERPEPDCELRPMMELTEGEGKSFPGDCRFQIRFKSAPEDFIGLQVQVSLNQVQTRSYPYLYCVIVAKKPFGLFSRPAPFDTGEIIEPKEMDDVDVYVIRQVTEGGGYHTDAHAQRRIFSTSMTTAKRLIRAAPSR